MDVVESQRKARPFTTSVRHQKVPREEAQVTRYFFRQFVRARVTCSRVFFSWLSVRACVHGMGVRVEEYRIVLVCVWAAAV